MDNKMRENIESVLNGVKALSNTKQVVGEPYRIGETTIIPFLETSVGAGFGEFSLEKDASGMACRIKPIACLIIQNGFTKLINISNEDPIAKALDMIPDLVDKLTKKGVHSEDVNEAIEEIKDSYEA
ncbi:MAG: GerW family sporulation protein [Lachnospiraceae bacterium]|nr:GerW family sporulation protein [Lachnospiraceae bacterium]